MTRTSCLTCTWLREQQKDKCSAQVEYRCRVGYIKGTFSEMRAIANEWKGHCPGYERKYKEPENNAIRIRKPKFEVCLL